MTRIVFLGDIGVDKKHKNFGNISSRIFQADLIFSDLEGAFLPDERQVSWLSQFRARDYCSTDVFDLLEAFRVKGVWLANNHVYDFNIPIQYTKNLLARNDIVGFGAGSNLNQANEPLVVKHEQTTIKLFAFGWDVIGCKIAGNNREGVNPFSPAHTLSTIRKLRSVDSTSFVIFIFHWNFELERFPQPAHRQLAHDLINEGVDAIIGLHGHVAQGAELVRGKPVVYALGNWFYPVRQIGNYRLEYPPYASRELAFEIEVNGREVNDIRFHWHQFDAQQSVIHYEKTEGFEGDIFKQLTPFSGLSHEAYVDWFLANRTRRRGLPVYKNYQDIKRNKVKDDVVKLRQKFLELLVFLRLKNTPRT